MDSCLYVWNSLGKCFSCWMLLFVYVSIHTIRRPNMRTCRCVLAIWLIVQSKLILSLYAKKKKRLPSNNAFKRTKLTKRKKKRSHYFCDYYRWLFPTKKKCFFLSKAKTVISSEIAKMISSKAILRARNLFWASRKLKDILRLFDR